MVVSLKKEKKWAFVRKSQEQDRYLHYQIDGHKIEKNKKEKKPPDPPFFPLFYLYVGNSQGPSSSSFILRRQKFVFLVYQLPYF